MVAYQPFWLRKTLPEMTAEEWDAVCDGCGKCCLHKLEDDDTNEVYYTRIACRLLDRETARCSDYAHRLQRVPGCLSLRPENVAEFHWLPRSCSYRLLAEGEALPEWHPLMSGDSLSTLQQGRSVAGQVLSEMDVNEDDFEDHIVHWID